MRLPNFIILLWIDNAASLVWVVWILWKQLTRYHSEKDIGFWRQDSTSKLTSPSAIHYVEGVLQRCEYRPYFLPSFHQKIDRLSEYHLPTETPEHNLSLSSVCGSPNTAQTSPKSSPPSLAPGTESSGIKRSAIFQSPTAQLAVYTSSSVLDNNQDIGALDFGQRIVATSGASNFSRKRKRVTPPNETESDPTAGSDISSDHPSFTGTQEQQCNPESHYPERFESCRYDGLACLGRTGRLSHQSGCL
ncbi:hypothetical protein WAI453_013125 [Rhynchosporium graminicola]